MNVLLNRRIPPSLIDIDKLTIPVASIVELDNGMPLYTIDSGKKEIIKLELIFKAGKWYETGHMISKFCAKLMKEGTSGKTSQQISELFDFYGASFKVSSNAELSSMTVYTLKKHLDQILPLVNEILTEAIYPESEFEISKTNSRQSLLIKLQKNDFIASQKFLNVLYGDDHPFGYVVDPEHYDLIDLDEIKAFYRDYFTANNCSAIVSGVIDDRVVKAINKYIGSGLRVSGEEIEDPKHEPAEGQSKIHLIRKEKSVQSAIRMGMHMIGKKHVDHPKLTVVNTLFGGYFGSRLMSNIREDKGYTYGIYSSMNSFVHSGHLIIGTEVGHTVRDETINEISKEILRLKTETVSRVELDMVKNYMISKVLRSLDGPFNLSSSYKKLWIYGLDENYLHHLIQEIISINETEVKELANKYLSFDKMYQVAVG